MSKERLEFFSDSVLAIIITILVLGLHVPNVLPHASFREYLTAMAPLWPKFGSFVLSFIIIAIYWINHNYFFHKIDKITPGLVWLNILWLFTVSVIPFSTLLLGEHYDDHFPIVFYATNTLFAASAFYLLRLYVYRKALFKPGSAESPEYLGPARSVPGIVLSLAAIILAFINVYAALICILVYPIVYAAPSRIPWLTRRLLRKNSMR
jgi:uncharacterized membrane protein